jgi:hypothetical protein
MPTENGHNRWYSGPGVGGYCAGSIIGSGSWPGRDRISLAPGLSANRSKLMFVDRRQPVFRSRRSTVSSPRTPVDPFRATSVERCLSIPLRGGYTGERLHRPVVRRGEGRDGWRGVPGARGQAGAAGGRGVAPDAVSTGRPWSSGSRLINTAAWFGSRVVCSNAYYRSSRPPNAASRHYYLQRTRFGGIASENHTGAS